MTARRSTVRAGFTLIEVIIAITLTAIVLGISAAALSAATMARTTVLTHQRVDETESRLRVLLTDMLQHAPAAESVNEPLLTIERDGRGASLLFLSTGVLEPFGTGPVWRVRLTMDDSGLQLDAAPITGGVASAIHATAPSVRAFDVRVLESARSGEAARWRSDWPIANARPELVALDFTDAAFRGTTDRVHMSHVALHDVPLVVPLSPLDRPR